MEIPGITMSKLHYGADRMIKLTSCHSPIFGRIFENFIYNEYAVDILRGIVDNGDWLS